MAKATAATTATAAGAASVLVLAGVLLPSADSAPSALNTRPAFGVARGSHLAPFVAILLQVPAAHVQRDFLQPPRAWRDDLHLEKKLHPALLSVCFRSVMQGAGVGAGLGGAGLANGVGIFWKRHAAFDDFRSLQMLDPSHVQCPFLQLARRVPLHGKKNEHVAEESVSVKSVTHLIFPMCVALSLGTHCAPDFLPLEQKPARVSHWQWPSMHFALRLELQPPLNIPHTAFLSVSAKSGLAPSGNGSSGTSPEYFFSRVF